MKKIFSLFAAVLFASSMMAGSVTFSGADFTGGTADTGSAFSVTKNGVTVSATRAYGTGSELRVYGPNTQQGLEAGVLSVSAGDVKITKITPVFGQNTKMNFEEATPNATSWSIEATKQIRLSSLTVEIEGESGTSEGGEQGQGGGEEGGEVNLDVVYCEAALIEDTEGTYWQLNLYKDYDYESGVLTYPDLWIGVEPKSETGIAGTYTEDDIYFVQVYTAAKDSAEATQVSDLVVTRVDDSYYYFSFSFVGDDGKTYIVEAECGTIAYNYETEEDIELDDEISQGIEDIVLTEKAQKVVVDGAVYVIRDNKMYNVTGTRVR